MNEIIIQEFDKSPYEFTIFYKKNPLNNKVNIIVVERVFKNKNNENMDIIIAFKSGNYSLQRKRKETYKLKKIITKISKFIPEFYFGRYDIRCNSENDIKNGKNFKIVEVGGYDCMDTRYDVLLNSRFKNIKIIINWLYFKIKIWYVKCFKIKWL